MENFSIAVKGVLKGAGKAFATHPAAMINALLFAVTAIVRIHMDWEVQQEYNFLMNSIQWGLALGAVWSLTAITAANGRYNTKSAFLSANGIGLAISAIAVLLLYFFGESSLDRDYSYLSEIAISRVSVGIAIAIALFVYLASFTDDKSDFSKSFFMTHKAFFVSILYGLVLMAGVSGVFGAIQALLYNDMSNKVFQYISTLAGFMTFSIFIGYFPDMRKGNVDPRRSELQEQPKFIQVLFGYIMIPIMLALTLVLLLWTVRTVMAGVGSSFIRLSGIAASYAIGGIWLHIMVTHNKSGLATFYRKAYPYTALIILAFEAWALVVQVGNSGIKTVEYNFILIWLFTVASVILLIIMKEHSHRKIAILGCVLAALAVFPYIGYHSLPVRSQVGRLERLLISQNMLVDGNIIAAAEEPNRESREKITDAVMFLAYKDSKSIPDWMDEKLAQDREFQETFGFAKTWPLIEEEAMGSYAVTSLTLRPGVIEISQYDWAVNLREYYGKEDVVIEMDGENGSYKIYWDTMERGIPQLIIDLNGQTILQEDLEEYFEELIEKYPPGSRGFREADLDEMTVSFQSDELYVLLVFLNAEVGIDPKTGRKNYWIVISGMYINEK